MKIQRGKTALDPAFYGDLRDAVTTTHALLIKADLASPEVRAYLNEVRVILSSRMVSAAGSAQLRKHSITLNVRMLTEHRHLLLTTVVHEIAHLVACKFFGEPGHGKPWKELMIKLGQQPTRCFREPTSPVLDLPLGSGEALKARLLLSVG